MSYAKTTAIAALLIILGSPALAQLSKEEQAVLDRINADPRKRQQAGERLGLATRPAAAPARASATPMNTRAAAAASDAGPKPPNLLTKNTPAGRAYYQARTRELLLLPPDGTPRELGACPGLNLLLRQDWKDIGLLGCPLTTEKAAGAELSYSSDRVANNNVWTMRGTAAAYYNSMLDSSGLYYKTFGAYVTANRLLNSSPAQSKSDSDKIALGGVAEAGFETATGANYFRLRGGAVEDRLKNTSLVNITGEWIPVYSHGNINVHTPIAVLNNALILRFDPVLLVQYAAVTGKNQLLDFNDRTHALRIGPQLTMRLFPGLAANAFLSRMSGEVTYHWAYETYTSRGISWFQSSVTYNIDDAGQIGITGSYRNGRDEDTGTLTDIYKIALTGKI